VGKDTFSAPESGDKLGGLHEKAFPLTKLEGFFAREGRRVTVRWGGDEWTIGPPFKIIIEKGRANSIADFLGGAKRKLDKEYLQRQRRKTRLIYR